MQESPKTETILLAGGLGYIGSHIAVELYDYIVGEGQKHFGHPFKILIIDNLSNCRPTVLGRINEILGSTHSDSQGKSLIEYREMDVLDLSAIDTLFK